MKILLVDDIATNRKLLRVNLEAEGIETVEAADGVEALAALEREKVDAIISDILMPRMDGYRLCRELRKSEEFADAPFIFYTSTYTSPGDEKLALACGADMYLKKPAPAGVILSAVQELIDPARRPNRLASVPEEALVMREYNEALVRKLEERNDKLELARAEIERANAELERRVEQRTAELRAANEELEAFSHSIAHDLRSPLSAIDGFSHILIEHCRGKLGKEAMGYLQFITDGARRMNELTNDLLRLARANRAEMSIRDMDLSALSMAIILDLRAASPDRRVQYLDTPGIVACGDLGLLRIALENLIGNAWKYTSKTEEARIEFGMELQNGEPVYFVGDNGAGFDMEKAGKLFSTFERLHEASEFPGTGIGLSSVQRIIARHGGRIWASAAVGEGAKFFFTLGPKKEAQ